MGESPALLAFALAAAALTAATLAFVLRPLLRERRRVIFVASASALLLAPVLYAKLGAIGTLDDTHTVDAATASATRTLGDVREDLVTHLAHNPRDSRGWVLLARIELGQDRFTEAAVAYEHALDNPKAASDTSLWCEYADALALAQGGKLAGRPREIVGQALSRDPTHRQALEMAGSAALEAGEHDIAAAYWRMLLAQLPEGSGEQRDLRAALERVELQLAQARSRGDLLYDTHCVACHSKEIHWRDRKLATDWTSLLSQVDRWQRNGTLGWSGEEIEAVARYLNKAIYRFPPGKQVG